MFANLNKTSDHVQLRKYYNCSLAAKSTLEDIQHICNTLPPEKDPPAGGDTVPYSGKGKNGRRRE